MKMEQRSLSIFITLNRLKLVSYWKSLKISSPVSLCHPHSESLIPIYVVSCLSHWMDAHSVGFPRVWELHFLICSVFIQTLFRWKQTVFFWLFFSWECDNSLDGEYSTELYRVLCILGTEGPWGEMLSISGLQVPPMLCLNHYYLW